MRILLSQDSFILSVSRRFMPLENHWVETASASLYSITVVLLGRSVGTLTGSVEKQRAWLIESELETEAILLPHHLSH